MTQPITFAADRIVPGSDAFRAEWLEADGLGGYACGTVGGPRTRRYHALLLTATVPPTRRMVLVNGVEAWLERAGAPPIPLTTACYLPDILHPDAWRSLTRFDATPWPTWTHTLPDGATLTHEVLVAPDAAETVLRWHMPQPAGWRLCVRPLLSGRDQHALHAENPAFRFDATVIAGNASWRPYDGVPAIAALTNGSYTHAPLWRRNILYTWERDRGLDDHEDLASPGTFSFDLDRAEAVMILRAGDGLALRPHAHAAALAKAERATRAANPGLEGTVAASYLVDRNHGRTVLAGFPWFTDWGRDSFIALRGLALATGRLAEAQAILLEWSALVDQGMLPNRFPDDGGAAEFNAVDASLWFIIAVHDFLAAAPPNPDVESRLAAAAQSILSGYRAGTRYTIHMTDDALIAAGQPGVQLTWMDAKVADWVVTPRIGKPVEIQALWINALRIAARWSPAWLTLADRATASFRARFIRPDGSLFDVVDADHIPGRDDPTLRPNQIFAVGGLPYPLLDGAQARAVVDAVEAKLLTPLGLRTLSPDDPAYCPRYAGDLRARDGAYHQGTAWPWLMGPFVEAWLRTRPPTPAARAEAARRFLAPLEAHLSTDGLGHVCEVADGDAPHHPGGCPFQAWSVGELIRIRRMLAPSAPPPEDAAP
jgi:predicted glycogen debranching enzyme